MILKEDWYIYVESIKLCNRIESEFHFIFKDLFLLYYFLDSLHVEQFEI